MRKDLSQYHIGAWQNNEVWFITDATATKTLNSEKGLPAYFSQMKKKKTKKQNQSSEKARIKIMVTFYHVSETLKYN